MKKTPAIKRVEHLMAIQEHWFWGDSLRSRTMELRKTLPDIIATADNPLQFQRSDFVVSYFLWLAMLFVVCQALKQNNFSLPDSLQREINTHYDDLEDFRNWVFHVRPHFRSTEFLKLTNNSDFLESMNRIHFGIRDWLKNEIERLLMECGCDSRVAVFLAKLTRGEPLAGHERIERKDAEPKSDI